MWLAPVWWAVSLGVFSLIASWAFSRCKSLAGGPLWWYNGPWIRADRLKLSRQRKQKRASLRPQPGWLSFWTRAFVCHIGITVAALGRVPCGSEKSAVPRALSSLGAFNTRKAIFKHWNHLKKNVFALSSMEDLLSCSTNLDYPCTTRCSACLSYSLLSCSAPTYLSLLSLDISLPSTVRQR